MKRVPHPPRVGWQTEVEKWGLVYHTHQGQPYWNESAYYSFTPSEIDELESATQALGQLCLDAVQWVIDHQRFADLKIPPAFVFKIQESWEHDPPSIYGRFDLAYDGSGPPKMLEFNADTPTSLLEAAVIQWKWLEAEFPDHDQFNSIYEGLIEGWKRYRSEGKTHGNVIHFAHDESWEDELTITLLRDTAIEAGFETEGLLMQEIGWHTERRLFVDLKGRPIWNLFKLYPWEYVVSDQFAQPVLMSLPGINIIEPIWKMVLSNKGILPILWEMAPNHPNLLPAYFDGPRAMRSYVQKPLFSREGANIRIQTPGGVVESGGEYGAEGCIFQEYAALAEFDGNHAVVGSWLIDYEPRGIGIRETDGLITDDFARFVPHLIAD